MAEELTEKQLIISTHNSFIANKLGLSNLILINNKKSTRLDKLDSETQEFFKKLPGYQTLRLILSKKIILVEGPSDELLVQRAFRDKFKYIPIQKGIDVISVGLTFKRFLNIAQLIDKDICVVTDNDHDYENKIIKKYAEFAENEFIEVFFDNRNELNTLEPQVVDANSEDLESFAKIVGVDFNKYNTTELISKYLIQNKTDWALLAFESEENIKYPQYITDTINWANE